MPTATPEPVAAEVPTARAYTAAWPARTPKQRALLEYAAAALTIGVWAAGEALGLKVFVFPVVLLSWMAYFLTRGARDPSLFQAWGIAPTPWRSAWVLHAGAAVLALVVVGALGAIRSTFTVPGHVIIVLLLYPVWAFCQQFVLQNGVVANAATLGVPRAWLPVVGMATFAVVHLPDMGLVALTAMGGFLWTWVFLRAPNLWLLAIGHTIVGTFGFIWFLDRDPLANFPDILRLAEAVEGG